MLFGPAASRLGDELRPHVRARAGVPEGGGGGEDGARAAAGVEDAQAPKPFRPSCTSEAGVTPHVASGELPPSTLQPHHAAVTCVQMRKLPAERALRAGRQGVRGVRQRGDVHGRLRNKRVEARLHQEIK